MPIFIKTEQFTQQTLSLSIKERQVFLNAHKSWVVKINKNGHKVSSGYLIDSEGLPGEGGMLIIDTNSYEEAKYIVEQDPMITSGLVNWKLHEWVSVNGQLLAVSNEDKAS